MNIVVADQLPSSAIELLRSVSGWTIDARSQRKPDQLASDLAEADALIVRSATTVDRALIDGSPGAGSETVPPTAFLEYGRFKTPPTQRVRRRTITAAASARCLAGTGSSRRPGVRSSHQTGPSKSRRLTTLSVHAKC